MMTEPYKSKHLRVTALAGTLLIAGVAATPFLLSLVGAHGQRPWLVPEQARQRKNPVPAGEAAFQAARPIYVDLCAQCHGEEGKGDGPEAMMYSVKPADLTEAQMMSQMTDGEIFWKISQGRKPMPSFKKQLSEEQRWQLVHLLRTFVRPAAAARSQTKAAAAKKTSSKKPS